MDLVLLIIELKKLAGRSLNFAAGFILPLAVLNLSLGATIMLATPPGFESTPGTTSDQQIELVHMQMFGGLIHLHDGSGSSHTHAIVTLPKGVTEQELPPALAQTNNNWSLSISDNHLQTLNGSNSAANFWQDLTARGQVNTETLSNYNSLNLGRHFPAADPNPSGPFLGVPFKPPIL